LPPEAPPPIPSKAAPPPPDAEFKTVEILSPPLEPLKVILLTKILYLKQIKCYPK
jgi:hypothetical protein